MKSTTTSQFWELYGALPEAVRRRADRAFALWQLNPSARGLYFKRVGKQRPVYSVRIGRGYRALGLREEDTILWFWIGTHDDYERLLKHL
jgi:hypothetical protein